MVKATNKKLEPVAKSHVKKELVKSPKTGKMILKSSFDRLYGKKTATHQMRHRLSEDAPLPPALVKAIAAQKAEMTPEELKFTLERTTQPYLRELLKEQIQKEHEPRGSRTRGWRSRAPQKGKPREILHDACGDAAFLLPKDLKFPIMPKCGNGKEKSKCKCKIDCGGVRAALIRAKQFGYTHVAAAAEQLLKDKCKEPATPELIQQ